MTKFMTKKLASFATLVAPVVAVTGAAVAGGGGAEFDVAVTQLTDWLEGGLGAWQQAQMPLVAGRA